MLGFVSALFSSVSAKCTGGDGGDDLTASGAGSTGLALAADASKRHLKIGVSFASTFTFVVSFLMTFFDMAPTWLPTRVAITDPVARGKRLLIQ